MLSREPGRIVIIGSGAGGLTAGILLAKLGHAVIIVEKNEAAGGLMRSYRRQGFDCPVGIHYLGSLDEGQPLRRLWDCLGVSSGIALERMGNGSPIDRYVFDDFTFDLPEGLDAFEENLCLAFPREFGRVRALTRQLREVARHFSSLDMLLAPGEITVSLDQLAPMGDHLDRLACSSRLLSVLGVPCTLIGVPLRECPLFYYHMILASYLLSSWRVKGGGPAPADTFVKRFLTLGGELITGDGAVRIRTGNNRITGVRLASGRVLAADKVIAAIHPQAVKAMLPAGSLRSGPGGRIDAFENTKGLVVVTAALDGTAHPPLPHNLYRLQPDADGALNRGFFLQLRESGRPDRSLLTVMATSDIRDWQSWSDTRSGRRGVDYEMAKQTRADEYLGEAGGLIGPLKEPELIDVYTPLSIRDWVGSPEGSAYGIMRSSRQVMKTVFLNRPSLEGLYFAGQNILAPGIMGTTLGAFQVVRRVIGRERFSREVLEALR